MLHIFFQSLLIGYSGAIMPGPLLTLTIDRSLRLGASSAMLIPLGHVFVEFLLVVAIFLGFGKYLGSTPVQIAIGFLGGLLLFYLGMKMLKEGLAATSQAVSDEEGGDRQIRGGLLISGALLSLGNPYFLVWWAVVGLGLIMSAYNLFGMAGIALFYFGHILADLTWYGFVSMVVSRSRSFFVGKAYRLLVICLGVFLLIFGGGFLLNSLRTLIRLGAN